MGKRKRQGRRARDNGTAAIKANADKVTTLLGPVLDAYEHEHPLWRGERFLQLVRDSLENLRLRLEDSTESEITWDRPLVELRLELEWDWKRMSWNSGKLKAADLATEDTTIHGLSTVLDRHITLFLLDSLAGGVAWIASGDKRSLLLRKDVQAELDALPARSRKARVRQLVQPLILGLPDNSEEGSTNDPLASAAAALSRALHVEIPSDRSVYECVALLSFSGPVIDPTARTSFFPIEVGLFAFSSHGKKAISFGDWTQAQRSLLWSKLSDKLDALGTACGLLTKTRAGNPEVVAAQTSEVAEILEHVRALRAAPSRATATLRPELRLGRHLSERGHDYRELTVNGDPRSRDRIPLGLVDALMAVRANLKAHKDAKTKLLAFLERLGLPRDPTWITVTDEG